MANHPRYEIKSDSSGQYRFNLTATNGQVVLSSEAYTARAGCMNGVESVKKNSGDDSKYERKTSSDGQHYFNLHAANQQVIGTSERYSSEAAMEKGIESVKTNGPKAEVHEG